MSENKDNHGFSVSVAQEIGVHRAIMLQHFRHLQIAFVEADKSALEIWIKRSRRALTETYPYLSEKEIRGCLDRLERDDYIRAKVDNALNYDRTKSYQLSKKGWELLGLPPSAQKANREQKASDKKANGFDKRANDNVTKGPMNIGICSSIVDSFLTTTDTDATEFLIKTTTEFPNVTLAELKNLEAEKEKTPHISAPPPNKEKAPAPSESPARRYDAFDIDLDAAILKEDSLCRDRFGRDLKIGFEKATAEFPLYVDRFVENQKAETYNYPNTKEFRRHFFNWIPKVYGVPQPGNQCQTRNAAQPQSVLPRSLQSKVG